VAARRSRLRTASETEEADAFATDPVCGMVVETAGAIMAIQDGRRLHFCSAECAQRFQAQAS
jgi:YHS domain-containing protein